MHNDDSEKLKGLIAELTQSTTRTEAIRRALSVLEFVAVLESSPNLYVLNDEVDPD